MRFCDVLGLVAVLAVAGCGAPGDAAAQPSTVPRSAPVHFSYPTVDGQGSLGSAALFGRTSVVAFIATYDVASQAQVRFLSLEKRRHEPRLNVAAIVLEPPENLPLIVAFRDALRLDYPVALGDADLIAGGGPFGDVHGVPTTVILDRDGKIVWRHVGLAKDSDIEQALRGM